MSGELTLSSRDRSYLSKMQETHYQDKSFYQERYPHQTNFFSDESLYRLEIYQRREFSEYCGRPTECLPCGGMSRRLSEVVADGWQGRPTHVEDRLDTVLRSVAWNARGSMSGLIRPSATERVLTKATAVGPTEPQARKDRIDRTKRVQCRLTEGRSA